MIDHVADILRIYPTARFIFMVRDGRDVALSAKSSIFNHYHVFYSARRWQREQRAGLEWLKKLSPPQIMLLRYEELLADPAETVGRLCGFLEEPFDTSMLEYHRLTEAKKSGSLSISWENTARPVLDRNSGKFRQQLTAKEIMLIEQISGRELQDLGYPLVNSPERLLAAGPVKERVAYHFYEYMQKLRVETIHLIRDRNSAARIRKNLFMAWLRWSRKLIKPS
jgi:hypothetical protein